MRWGRRKRPNMIALLGWVQHDSWRCAYPDRYPQDEDCPCGLLHALEANGVDPEPWRVTVNPQQWFVREHDDGVFWIESAAERLGPYSEDEAVAVCERMNR